MSDYEEQNENDTQSLVSQLGTDPKTLAKGLVDKIKLTYLVGSDKIPDQFKPALFFLVQNDVVNNDKSYEESIMENYLTLLEAIGGRGQEMLIRAENAEKGIPVNISPPPERPSLTDKILGRENVEEYERYKERRDLGLE